MNQFLAIDSVNASKFIWNDTLHCFRSPNDEYVDGYKGTIILYFSLDTGNKQVKDHIPDSVSTLKFTTSILASDSKVTSYFSNRYSGKILSSVDELTDLTPDSFSSASSGTKNTKADGWSLSFSFSADSLREVSKYYFAVEYEFTAASASGSSSLSGNRNASALVYSEAVR